MKNIIVIGAGLSGIYAATLLQKHYNVTILEARERIGGRVFTVDGFDMGPSWVWQHQKNILALIQENHLEIFAQYTQGEALYDTPSKVERFTPPPSPPSARLKGGVIALVEALEKKLILDTIKLNEAVISIENSANGIIVNTVKSSYQADLVINTLPPRLAASSINYTPALPQNVLQTLSQTPTWMGGSAKCTIVFKTAFWRAQGLSGFGFSLVGPLGELHDACTEEKAALFGFFQAKAIKTEDAVREQMKRLFGEDTKQIESIYITDWIQETFTSTKQDSKALSVHPNYGYDIKVYKGRLVFSGTEASFQEGGYLEGAICNMQTLCRYLEVKTW